MNLRELKSGGYLVSEELALATLNRGREAETKTPWVARVALGIGAWLAGIFFTGFLGILLDFNNELAMAVVGFVIASGSVFLLRLRKGVFLEQLALAVGFAGHVMVFIGLHEVHSNDWVGPFIGALVLCGPVYWFSKNSVQRFLSISWVWMTGWIATTDWSGPSGSFSEWLPGCPFFGALAVVLAYLSGWRNKASPVWRPAMWASVVGLLGMLFWSSLQFNLGFGDSPMGLVFGVGAAVAISGVLWHLVRPEEKTVIGFGAFAVLLLGLGVSGAPGVVVSLGLMAIAKVRNDRHLGWIAILALGHFLIAFYYNLDISLIRKSIVLMVSGVIFLGFRWLLFRGAKRESALADTGVSGKNGGLLKTIMIVVNCALVLAVVNGAIARKQAVIETGRTVYLQLAPVDPRSLMQGDYMTLRYAISREIDTGEKKENAPTRGRIVLNLDDKGIATFSRIEDAETELKEGDALLKYRKWRRGWRFGIESFFFQEGLGNRYAAAKYAELRLSPDGDAVLVDLRGDKLAELSSEVRPDEIPAEDAEPNP